jgi:hypothetical protein
VNKKKLEHKAQQSIKEEGSKSKVTTVLKHEDFRKVPGLLEYINEMGAEKAFRGDQMASGILRKFHATVEKNLLFRTAKKAHELVYGKDHSDVVALEDLMQRIGEDGGKLIWVHGRDIGKTDEDADKYFGLVWIAPFCHVLVESFGDMYTTDGTHGVSVNNWRAIPFCVVNSLKNPFPVAMAFCTSENAAVLAFMAREIHQKCKEHNVQSPFGDDDFDPSTMNRVQPPLPDADVLDEKFICMPEWRAFVHSLIRIRVRRRDTLRSWRSDAGILQGARTCEDANLFGLLSTHCCSRCAAQVREWP